MQRHTLKQNNSKVAKKRVGRGGKRGKTSGRGTKGQKARAGRKIRPAWRDIIKKLPKQRGYRFSSIQTRALPINLSLLEKHFVTGDVVNVASLVEKDIAKKRGGKMPKVKILGFGKLTKKLSVSGIPLSESAKQAIMEVGGTIA
ncbi:MAG: 50S ribosomal protein L15 [Candidatus Vogelbacteria bacterium CG10_big_fil_rev_8_21_14_0_10_45_14]|uniref:Large ribosomal subunit protein uL15 n=1 Tax=Candidatus Vogelbacteria bacterium CG10_big_fil_rev_8_21_14_0_10_45_14 TaxID=1975042 RepID=A0A2H0RK01_9BACT|nr:MAG: 50S ribosomal protein L15 [Candidatus Vogelbacteria bacterium CG10_big_fil_rev_8_21_14_0_10_45_14]